MITDADRETVARYMTLSAQLRESRLAGMIDMEVHRVLNDEHLEAESAMRDLWDRLLAP